MSKPICRVQNDSLWNQRIKASTHAGIVSSDLYRMKFPRLGKTFATRALAASRQIPLLVPRTPRAPLGQGSKRVRHCGRPQHMSSQAQGCLV